MPYPQNPAATGDMIVGNYTSRSWLRLTVGSDGDVLMADSLGGTNGLSWSSTFSTPKSFVSDLTLWDSTGAAKRSWLRTDLAGPTNLWNEDANQTLRIGGTSVGSALTYTQVVGEHLFSASSARDLSFEMNASKQAIFRHGSTQALVINAAANRNYVPVQAYDATAAGYLTMTADSSGYGYLYSSHVQHNMYLAGDGTSSRGLRVRTDSNDIWLESTSGDIDIIRNVRSGGRHIWMHNYGQIMRLTSTGWDINVPGTFAETTALTNSVNYALNIDHSTTGTPVAGFGAGATFRLHDSVNVLTTCATWDVKWEDPVGPNYDSSISFRVLQNGAYGNPLLTLSGAARQATVDGTLLTTGNVGFNNLGPIAIPTAYTQTYATASRTHANLTSATLTDNTGETPDTTIEQISIRSSKFWAFDSPSGSSGTFYFGGFYKWHTAAFTPIVGGTNVGTANSSYAAHAVLIDGAAGLGQTVSVSGTSINDSGTRTTLDTESITTDGTANKYYETSKKWIGQVSYKFVSGSAVTINAGFAKYWDFGNTDFTVKGLEATWLGGANDTSADIELIHHKDTGWTYGAGGTPTLPTAIASMATDHSTEGDVKNNENGAWKRTNLSTTVLGSSSEGILFEVTTTSNKAFELGTLQVDVDGSDLANENFSDLADQINKLRADMENTKQVLNSTIDDGQSYGLLQ